MRLAEARKLLADVVDHPEIATELIEEIEEARATVDARRAQQRGRRKPSGRGRGRPRMTPDQADTAKERRRALTRERVRRYRARNAENRRAPSKPQAQRSP